MSTSPFKFLASLVMTVGFVIATVAGTVYGIEGAGRAVRFIAWAEFGLSLCLLSDSAVAAVRRDRRASPFPRWIDPLCGGVALCLLVWYGWTATAIAVAGRLMLMTRLSETTPPPDGPATT